MGRLGVLGNASRRRRRLGIIAAIVVLASAAGAGQAVAAPISGSVFNDFNDNGAASTSPATDVGVGGITVSAFAADGSQLDQASTANDGTYVINVPNGSGVVRVEFDGLPAGYFSARTNTAAAPPPGPLSDTTVHFVDVNDAAADTDVSLGILRPAEYCQDNPDVALACMVLGDPADPDVADEATIKRFPFTAGAPSTEPTLPPYDQPAATTLATYGQTGTLWGTVWSHEADTIFAGAYMRRHADFGPGGTGAIYAVDPNGGGVSVHADLNAIFGAGTAGNNPHQPQANCVAAPNDDYLCDNFDTTRSQIGKVALGGMALSDDEETLYMMNLADRSLYAMPVDTPPNAGNIQVSPAPLDPPGCPAASDVRPFAVSFDHGRLYVGITCSADSTDNPADLAAYVYTVDPATLAFSGAPVFQASLDYDRGCFITLANCDANHPADWNPWRDNFAIPHCWPTGCGIFPQPLLTDIEFRGNGDMALGIRDRSGDQLGNFAFENPADPNSAHQGVAAGETLLACGDPGSGWTLESNGSCGGRDGSGLGNGEGVGGGEFFGEDDYTLFVDHDQISLGGLLWIPGYNELAATVYDPINVPDADATADQGVRWWTGTDGAFTRAYRVQNGSLGVTDPTFGKANGLGDIEALCEAAPVQIGNRVWVDSDDDGQQDAGEQPLGGVTVELLDAGGTVIATTSTDGAGRYYFDELNVAGGLDTETDYTVSIPLNQAVLAPYVVTGPNRGANDTDSDGVQTAGTSRTAATTGGPGENDHTFDFGFNLRQPDRPPEDPDEPPDDPEEPPDEPRDRRGEPEVTKVANKQVVEPGERIEYTIVVRNKVRRTVLRNVRVCDTLPRGLVLVNAPGADLRDGRLCWTIRRLRYSPPGEGTEFTVIARVTADAAGGLVNTARVPGDRDRERVRVRQDPPPPPEGGVTG
jgi:uncharacterized repeat protein (TIGR01451 family)